MLLIKNKTVRQAFGLIETFNLLSLKLLLKNKTNSRLYPGKVYREYMNLAKEDKWLSKEILEIINIDNSSRITLEMLPGKGIFTPIDELAYMAMLTDHIKPKNVFEIGTFRGRTALNFAINSPDDCKVYTLDLPEEARTEDMIAQVSDADRGIINNSRTGIDYKGKDVEHKITQLFGNSMTFDYSDYHNKMDIVFVDGAHHYEAVKSDTENALKMIKRGGCILWHDFANYGDYNDVTRVICETFPQSKIIQIGNTQLALYWATDK